MSETVTAHSSDLPTRAESTFSVPVSTARTLLLAAAIAALATLALSVATATAVFHAAVAGYWALGLTLLALLPVIAALLTAWPFTQGCASTDSAGRPKRTTTSSISGGTVPGPPTPVGSPWACACRSSSCVCSCCS